MTAQGRVIPWPNIIMSCWIMPSQRGSSGVPWSFARCATDARAPFSLPSSPFQSAKRIDTSVTTPGAFRMRASSITIAVPDPSSLAVSP
jgi:hypothetical protein